VRVEHEYVRKGALNLFAAFDTRSGHVTGILRRRKRQVEFIELLEKIDLETPAEITLIHLAQTTSAFIAANKRALGSRRTRGSRSTLRRCIAPG
jgi:hypothetical protein